MRFELDETSVSAIKEGAAISVGIDHDKYKHAIEQLQHSVRNA